MKNIIFLLAIIALWGCDKDKKDESTTFGLFADIKRTTPGDSIQLRIINAPSAVQFSIDPQAGRISNGLLYIAPGSIAGDSLNVTITATSLDKSAAVTITVVRRNSSDTTFTFNQHIMPLLTSSCNFQACHGNGSRAGGVNLATYDSVFLHLVAYQPEFSKLYQSLIKTDPLRRMPPAGKLHPHQINRVFRWIEQGALNN
jgi:hypothetical protein